MDFNVNIEQRKKAWYSWVKNHGDDTVWDISYEVMAIGGLGFASGWMGWTSNQWQTQYFKQLYPVQQTCCAAPYFNFYFERAYNNVALHAGDNNGNGSQILFCDNDCD